MNEQAQATGNPPEVAFSVNDIERRFYGPTDIANAGEYVSVCNDAAEAAKIPVFWNFNPEEDLRDGYGIAIAPLRERTGQGSMNTIGVVFGTCPSYDAVVLDTKGQLFVQDLVQDVIVGKLITAARPKPNEKLGQTPFTLPVSIEDFIETRRGESLKSFTEIAPTFVAAFKRLGMKYLNSTMLRQCLQSTEFAAQQFPKIQQDNWIVAINQMRDAAINKKLDPAIYDHWLEGRDSAGMTEINDESILSALASLTAPAAPAAPAVEAAPVAQEFVTETEQRAAERLDAETVDDLDADQIIA